MGEDYWECYCTDECSETHTNSGSIVSHSGRLMLDNLAADDRSADRLFCSGTDLNRLCPDLSSSANWTRLFRIWNGKRILLAGDSIIRQLRDAVECGSRALGGSFARSRLANVLWDPPFVENATGSPCITDRLSGKFSGIQGRVSRSEVKTPEHEFTIDLFFHYFVTDSCRAVCGKEAEEQGCSLCATAEGIYHGDIATADGLAKWASQYDHAFFNMGHDMFMPALISSESTRLMRKTQALIDAARSRRVTAKLIFAEHMPQHFPDSDRTGNFKGVDRSTGSCSCHLQNIGHQDVAINNREVGAKMLQNGIKVAKMWDILKEEGCNKHTSRRRNDCTHYRMDAANVWQLAADSFAEVLS